GGSSNGTVFAINTDGTAFRIMHSFSSLSTNFSGHYLNNDGAKPIAELLVLGNKVYGTTYTGGAQGSGTLFIVNTDGTCFSVLHSFAAYYSNSCGLDCYFYTNTEGIGPIGSLIMVTNTIYGTAVRGGQVGAGTVFSFSLPPTLTVTQAGRNVVLFWPTN